RGNHPWKRQYLHWPFSWFIWFNKEFFLCLYSIYAGYSLSDCSLDTDPDFKEEKGQAQNLCGDILRSYLDTTAFPAPSFNFLINHNILILGCFPNDVNIRVTMVSMYACLGN